ncbi:MAG: hypothetical protein L6R35_001739 [Caloplaca aegaea]|nr:MAG: hypothetical protein L6R35_001739 [Caloplaca aegaea]
MDFAPYQDTAPENTRALSPPPRRSSSRSPNPKSPPPGPGTTDPFLSSTLPAPSHFTDDPGRDGRGFGNADLEGGRMGVDLFETSLPLRLDYEAMLAYLLLPPAGGVLLLLTEHKSDYVRFHAWQSSLVFTAIFILHLIFSWSKWLSWILFVLDLGLIAFLTLHAYQDANNLDRLELPFFGGLASSFVDAE